MFLHIGNCKEHLSATGLLLPGNLHLEDLLPKERKQRLHLYACFCHILYEVGLNDKRYKFDDFISLDSRQLRFLLTTKETTKIKNDLRTWGVIECDNTYTIATESTPGKCLGYRFTEAYRNTTPQVYQLQNRSLLKKLELISKGKAEKVETLRKESLAIDFLFRQVQNLDIAWGEAFDYALQQHPQAIALGWQQFKMSSKKMKFEDFVYHPIPDSPLPVVFPMLEFSKSVYNKFYNVHRFSLALSGNAEATTFTRCEKTGRLYTNLNGLAKEYRRFIHHRSRKQLRLVDIGECQPFLFACHLKAIATTTWESRVPEDVSLYIEKTSKREFYDFMMYKHGAPKHTRDKFKQALFASAFYSDTTIAEKPSNLICKTFIETFPNVYKELRKLKERMGVGKLSHSMMKLESEIMIDTVCGKIASFYGDDFFVATIHDAIVTTADKVPIVIDLIKEAFMAKFGIIPTIKAEDFNHDDLPF